MHHRPQAESLGLRGLCLAPADGAIARHLCFELDIVSAVFAVAVFTHVRRHLPLSVVAIAPWAGAEFQLTN